MKYVLDSSVALKWVLPEPDSPKAIQLRDDYHNSVHELIAPDTFLVETLHVLTKAERQKKISAGDGMILWKSIRADVPVLFPHIPLLDRAYQIASVAGKGIYDCLFVALAEREQCEFVTADTKLISNLQTKFPFLVSLASLP